MIVKKGPGFFLPVAGMQFGGLSCDTGRNLGPQSTAKLRSALDAGLK